MEMTLAEWLALGGFGVTLAGAVSGFTKWAITREIDAKLADEREERAKGLLAAVESRNAEMEKFRNDWADSQRTQDNNFGEMGSALRRFIETVEKQVREVELWGRDHYVQKAEFEKAIDKLAAEIKAGNADLKADFKEGIRELKSQLPAGD